MTDEVTKDDQPGPTWAPNETEAATALGLSADEWQALKALAGFPARDKSKGWPVAQIATWLREGTPDLDDTPVDTPEEAAEQHQQQIANADANDLIDHDTTKKLVQQTPTPADEDELNIIELVLPIAKPREGTYIATQMGRVDVRLDRFEELPGFKRLHAGLRAENAEFPNGKPVDSPQDVVRWVMWHVTQQCKKAA